MSRQSDELRRFVAETMVQTTVLVEFLRRFAQIHPAYAALVEDALRQTAHTVDYAAQREIRDPPRYDYEFAAGIVDVIRFGALASPEEVEAFKQSHRLHS